MTASVDETYATMMDGVSHLSTYLHFNLGDGNFQCGVKLYTLHTPSRGDAYVCPCRKDARSYGVWEECRPSLALRWGTQLPVICK